MKNINNVEKFEAKLQNIRVNREVTTIQGEVFNFTRRRRAAETFSIKQRHMIEHKNITTTKGNAVREESAGSNASTRNLTVRKRKHTHNRFASILNR